MARKPEKLTVSMSAAQKRQIEKLIASGQYNSPQAVISKSLELLKFHEQNFVGSIAELREKVAEGMEDIRAGRVYDGEEVFKEIGALSRIARRKTA